MDQAQELSQETIREFVGAAHGDLAQVKALHQQDPGLLNARYLEWNETALEAAAHMGRWGIAEYLLSQGAPLTICAASMLGMTGRVAEFLQTDPGLAHATGAHGIPVLFHAALSGDTEIAELLVAHGGGEGLDQALHGATAYGHKELAEWLLDRGANVNVLDWQNKTPLRVAVEMGSTDLAALLRQRGGMEWPAPYG